MKIDINSGGEICVVNVSGEKPEEMAADIFNLNRKVLIITDDKVPESYYRPIEKLCNKSHVLVLPHGEKYKSMGAYAYTLDFLIKNNFYREDCIVAVGGGTVSDLSGFVAATFERGIDYYSVPTTLLSQVDASIGGKTAVNYENYKNMVGAFYPPRAVAVAPCVLETLDDRQFASGMAEVIKMAVCLNKGLFERLENIGNLQELRDNPIAMKKIIAESILNKQKIIEKDEKERGVRKLLNFGHTIGHGVESMFIGERLIEGELLHGECVAIGMLPMCGKNVRKRLKGILRAFNLPISLPQEVKLQTLMDYIGHDKKIDQDGFNIITVDEIGHGNVSKVPEEKLREMIMEGELL